MPSTRSGHVVAMQPHFERAHNQIASICLHIGRLREARIAHDHAQQSNPKARSGNLEFFYLYSGDFARADEAGKPGWRTGRIASIRFSFTRNRRSSAAIWTLAEQRLAMALERFPDEPLITSLQGILHARRHRTGLALECVRRALDLPRSFGHTHHTYYQIACVHAVLGDTEKAMAWARTERRHRVRLLAVLPGGSASRTVARHGGIQAARRRPRTEVQHARDPERRGPCVRARVSPLPSFSNRRRAGAAPSAC